MNTQTSLRLETPPNRRASATLAALFLVVASAAGLSACGGGGSSSTAPVAVSPTPPAPSPTPAPPALASATTLRCVCTGTGASAVCQPANANLAPDACSDAGEKKWMRSFIDEKYLFYKGTNAYVAANPAAREPAGFGGTPAAYFTELTLTANPANDKFSFTLPTTELNAVFSGAASGGYGISLSSATPSYRVIYTQPDSPAARAGVPRGAAIASINGAAMVSQGGRSFFPTQAAIDAYVRPAIGQVLTLGYVPIGSSQIVTVNLTAASVTPSPVIVTKLIDTPQGKVGYIVMNDFLALAQNEMADAINTLRVGGAQDLVLDLRYNGGGYVFISAQVAYMIGGSNVLGVPVFNRLTYNDKRQADNFSYPFLTTYQSIGNPSERAGSLPATLNLPRVYVLTQSGTCSASEAVINGLRGTRVGTSGVDVIQIGGTTCGKPYGFSGYENRLTTHEAIEFDGLNNKGEGGYVNGIAANCPAADDLTKSLGDPTEGMLARALAARAGTACTPTSFAREAIQAANAEPVGRTTMPGERGGMIHVPTLKLK